MSLWEDITSPTAKRKKYQYDNKPLTLFEKQTGVGPKYRAVYRSNDTIIIKSKWHKQAWRALEELDHLVQLATATVYAAADNGFSRERVGANLHRYNEEM